MEDLQPEELPSADLKDVVGGYRRSAGQMRENPAGAAEKVGNRTVYRGGAT